MSKYGLTIEPLGGLANRMRVIDSAYFLANSLGIPLTVHWYQDSSCNCRFDYLFKSIPGIRIIERNTAHFLVRFVRRFLPLWLFIANRRYVGQSELEKVDINKSCIFDNFKTNSLYIATYSDFLNTRRNFDYFIPIDSIKKEIEDLTIDFDSLTYGIHIRRTDNSISIKNSTTNAFVLLMQIEVDRNSSCRFFVASDDPTEIKKLESHFPGRILKHAIQNIDRNTSSAIQEALVDLYCLSRTSKIIGSYWSSFSEVAARLSGAELMIARNDQEPGVIYDAE